MTEFGPKLPSGMATRAVVSRRERLAKPALLDPDFHLAKRHAPTGTVDNRDCEPLTRVLVNKFNRGRTAEKV